MTRLIEVQQVGPDSWLTTVYHSWWYRPRKIVKQFINDDDVQAMREAKTLQDNFSGYSIIKVVT